MKIIVAHAERQHSFYTAIALKQAGYLYKYITTIYDKPDSITNKVKKLLRGRLRKKAESRKTELLNDSDVVQFNELFNLIITAISKIPKSTNLCRYLRRLNAVVFGKRVAKYALKNNVDAIVLYDSYGYGCIKYLKEKNSRIKVFLDVTSMTMPFTLKTFKDIEKKTGDKKLIEENSYLKNKKVLKRSFYEISNADLLFAGSSIAKKSIEYCGVSSDKIVLNPYGVNLDKFKFSDKKQSDCPLRLITVCQLIRRKGVLQLLEILSHYRDKEVLLDIVGDYDPESDIYLKYSDKTNLFFHGFITHNELSDLYQRADVFVFPSFGEGMALVGLEAMAAGTPVICSDYSGINDLIINYENGIVTKTGNKNSVKKAIDWMLQHRDSIPEMGRAARRSVSRYSWDDYYNRTAALIKDYFKA